MITFTVWILHKCIEITGAKYTLSYNKCVKLDGKKMCSWDLHVICRLYVPVIKQNPPKQKTLKMLLARFIMYCILYSNENMNNSDLSVIQNGLKSNVFSDLFVTFIV